MSSFLLTSAPFIPMKRLFFVLAILAVVLVAGFGSGMALTRIARWISEPPALREGDYREVIESVGSPIVLLSTTTCPWCEKTRQWLRDNNVTYRDCLVDQDEFAGGLLDEVGVKTVPQLVTANQIVTGYNVDLLNQVTRDVQTLEWTPAVVRCNPASTPTQQ